MDFAFGTLSTLELKHYHHQLSRKGVQHQHKIMPRQPKPNEPITLFTTVGMNVNVNSVHCIYTTDGSEPTSKNGIQVKFEKTEILWDSFIWGYISSWKVTLKGFPKHTRLNYRIYAKTTNGEKIYADYPDLKKSSENAANRYFSQNLPPDKEVHLGSTYPGTIFTLRINPIAAPSWAKDAVIYQLMVDRFNPGSSKSWIQTSDLSTRMGGTLEGVLEKLDYLSNLGINTVWMNPIWETPSYHGYDTSDFREVDARLGTKEVLHQLIQSAHERNIHILFDMACNHVSNYHPIFQKAFRDSTSAYRKWFTFDDSELGYRAFFGVESMPEINLNHPDARDWMIENALYWIEEFNIDGYRLDYANGAGPDFWSYFVEACKTAKTDIFCFGEIIETPNVLQTYTGRLDGALDFHLNHALRQTYALENWTIEDFENFLDHHQVYMDPELIMPTFLDNHDMDRFMFAAKNQKETYIRALKKLLSLPNPPVIFYGSEIGLKQNKSTKQGGLDFCRPAMLWGDAQDKDLLEETKSIIEKRKTNQKAST